MGRHGQKLFVGEQMRQKLTFGIISLILGAVFLWLSLRGCGHHNPIISQPPLPPIPLTPVPIEIKKPILKATTKTAKTAKSAKPSIPAVSELAPPPVKIFKELIPKNIEIVRVYYANILAAPNSSIEFDINGSGFTKEFEKMIKVESGQPEAAVKNLALVTPNQIHGTLVITSKSETRVAFPQVLIGGKVVFQAPEPFAVIRPREVLNLIFTEMGETGRSGRFRVFTNLDQEMYADFKVFVSTPAIQVTDLSPTFPFIVDGTVIIGPAVGGEYGISVTLKDKTIWHKDGVIRVIKPNVGQSGLIQRVQAIDGFHRPGDKVTFVVQGSGFQPDDAKILVAQVKDLELLSSTYTYLAPGRMELVIALPPEAPEKTYGLTLSAGDGVLQDLPGAFRVVGKNWTRELKLNPELTPGATSTFTIQGRDLSADFIGGLKIELDEPDLLIGPLILVNPQEASAPISAGANVKPGDYLLHITSKGTPVNPQFGSLIRVSPQKQP